MQCAVESISCMLLISYVIELYFVDTFKEYGTKPLKCNEVLISIFQNMLPSLLIVYATFYIVLHAWQNMFGEMLLFADRMFYKVSTDRYFFRIHSIWKTIDFTYMIHADKVLLASSLLIRETAKWEHQNATQLHKTMTIWVKNKKKTNKITNYLKSRISNRQIIQ